MLRVQGIYVGSVAACASRTSNDHSNNNGDSSTTSFEGRQEQPIAPSDERDKVQLVLSLVTEWKTLCEAHGHHPHPEDTDTIDSDHDPIPTRTIPRKPCQSQAKK